MSTNIMLNTGHHVYLSQKALKSLENISAAASSKMSNNNNNDETGQLIKKSKKENSTSPSPWDYDAYLERLKTFSKSISLFLVRNARNLDPKECARYGWQCLNFESFECTVCSEKIVLKGSETPSSEEWAQRLNSLHQEYCIWFENPSPAYFQDITFFSVLNINQRKEAIQNTFEEILVHLQTLPRISPSALKLFWQKMKPELDQFIKETLNKDPINLTHHQQKAVVYLLTGWKHSKSLSGSMCCTECQRVVGLWNFEQDGAAATGSLFRALDQAEIKNWSENEPKKTEKESQGGKERVSSDDKMSLSREISKDDDENDDDENDDDENDDDENDDDENDDDDDKEESENGEYLDQYELKDEYPTHIRAKALQSLQEIDAVSIPVILDRFSMSDIPPLQHTKYFLAPEITIQKFIEVIKKHEKDEELELYLFAGKSLAESTVTIRKLYQANKDEEDSFLYLRYHNENSLESVLESDESGNSDMSVTDHEDSSSSKSRQGHEPSDDAVQGHDIRALCENDDDDEEEECNPAEFAQDLYGDLDPSQVEEVCNDLRTRFPDMIPVFTVDHTEKNYLFPAKFTVRQLIAYFEPEEEVAKALQVGLIHPVKECEPGPDEKLCDLFKHYAFCGALNIFFTNFDPMSVGSDDDNEQSDEVPFETRFEYSLEQRKSASNKLKKSHNEFVPTILEPILSEETEDAEDGKFLVHRTMTVENMMAYLAANGFGKVQLFSHFVEQLDPATTFGALQEQYQHEDGLLYMLYNSKDAPINLIQNECDDFSSSKVEQVTRELSRQYPTSSFVLVKPEKKKDSSPELKFVVPKKWTLKQLETYMIETQNLPLASLTGPKNTLIDEFDDTDGLITLTYRVLEKTNNKPQVTPKTKKPTNSVSPQTTSSKKSEKKTTPQKKQKTIKPTTDSETTKTTTTITTKTKTTTTKTTENNKSQVEQEEGPQSLYVPHADEGNIFNPFQEHRWFCPWLKSWTQVPQKCKAQPQAPSSAQPLSKTRIYSLLSNVFQ